MRGIKQVQGVFTSTVMLLFLGACAFLPRPVESPIPVQAYGDATAAEEIFVLLPGVQDSMDVFENSGFVPFSVEATEGRRNSLFLAVDAHLGYYKQRDIDVRLKDEVLRHFPDKKVTAVGVSLGGFGALLTAKRHPELFDRLVLVAPFLGWPGMVEEINQDPNRLPEDEVDAEFRALWAWLRNGADGIPITILYGEDDRFRKAYVHLARVAPNIGFRGAEGGHDWPTWKGLWAAWLKEDLAKQNNLARRPAF